MSQAIDRESSATPVSFSELVVEFSGFDGGVLNAEYARSSFRWVIDFDVIEFGEFDEDESCQIGYTSRLNGDTTRSTKASE